MQKWTLTTAYALPRGRFSDGFHVFAVEWEPEVIRFYVDGELFATKTPRDIPAGGRWVYDHPFFILLNLAVGGNLPGKPGNWRDFAAGRLSFGGSLSKSSYRGIAVTSGALYLSGIIERTPAVWVAAVLLLAAGVALLIGFVTPFATSLVGICVVGILFSWFPAPPLALMGARLAALVIVITAVGIALLGPAAFSLDSWLFGRREIVIPPDPPES